ncbi:MAG: hypothetical protein A3I13_03985 [Gammaproteobacteria bacterium RIFCSPLOWO2_02_FULL_47_50]|nr:MAG: hypothetical protein A2W76_08975 [Gammaproteobacteria bacterium RIFCSPLOWO2_12_47_11]OGT79427.1 MAG: hypothetical protein A3I13_03985 [Gammaproteobacteria bacterium RIFCSPLOWO2_02_FULL_47_50]
MAKYYVPTGGVESWRKLLAEPNKHWRTGYSARSLANCWEEAQGFPKSVVDVFQSLLFEMLKIYQDGPGKHIKLARNQY